jgi:hypothetical protein
MSKFFQKKAESSSSSEESSSEEEAPQKEKQSLKTNKKFFNDDSDEDQQQDRVVVKTSEKRIEALLALFDKTKNHIKIADFNGLFEDFESIRDELNRCVGQHFATDKYQQLPGWVLKNLMEMEDCIASVTNAEKKKMNKLNSTAYNKVRQGLKKYLAENGDDENTFAAQLEKFRANPVQAEDPRAKQGKKAAKESASGSSDSSSDSSGSESDAGKSKAKSDSGDSSDSSDSSSSSSSSSEDSESSDESDKAGSD